MHLQLGLPQIDQAVGGFLNTLLRQVGAQSDMRKRQDANLVFGQKRASWLDALSRSLSEAARNSAVRAFHSSRTLQTASLDKLELVGDEVVENKIIASRIALTAMETLAPGLDALRIRMKSLGDVDWPDADLLLPDTFSLLLVESWLEVQLARDDLQLCMEPLQRAATALMQSGYDEINRFLAEQGVSAERAVRLRTREAPSSTSSAAPLAGREASGGIAPQALDQSRYAVQSGHYGGGMSGDVVQRDPRFAVPGGMSGGGVAFHGPGVGSSGASFGGPVVSGGWAGAGGGGGDAGVMYPGGPSVTAGPRGQGVSGGPGGFFVAPPIAMARGRAQQAMTQLRQILVPAGGGAPLIGIARPASAGLAQALAMQPLHAGGGDSTIDAAIEGGRYTAAIVAKVASKARESSTKLKEKAETDSEKAIIEVVALMFQSILTEERIAPAVRVWFARLQVPVLRVALDEPEFFSDEGHPTRKLIDRMGAVALGFDAASVNADTLEGEVRRIVQVIEQYPETGRRVFELVYAEFERFLTKHLTEKAGTAKVISVAQQVEQKETLAIKYTIEFRTLLNDVSVDDEVRQFLFKIWAEVLALAAMKNGAQHEATMSFKRTAADLVWAASAKPNRSERTQVIQSLPAILQRLRAGLVLMGMEGEAQDLQIKVLTDTLAKAFLSKAAPIPLEHIEAMVRRLANVEEFLGDDVLGELPLDAENIEMMTGIDSAALQVIADDGTKVGESMLAWAQQLALGSWFTLNHNGTSAAVQYVWHSERKQLHLFVANDGMTYLVQLNRLASYLEAKLLVPSEEDALTTRATRDAIEKLNANPERLLA